MRVRCGTQHSTRKGEAHRVEELLRAAISTTGTMTAAVLVMEKDLGTRECLSAEPGFEWSHERGSEARERTHSNGPLDQLKPTWNADGHEQHPDKHD